MTGILGIIGILVRISYQLGSLVERFGDHVVSAGKIHDDQESRIRNLEGRRRR